MLSARTLSLSYCIMTRKKINVSRISWAALSTLAPCPVVSSGAAETFVAPCPIPLVRPLAQRFEFQASSSLCNCHLQQHQQIRLQSARRNYDYDPKESAEKTGFLGKIQAKAKSLLPFLKSDEEKSAAIESQRRKDEITSSIDRSLKDAPLGVRLMGMMAGSIAARVASGIADSMAEQSRLMDDLLDEAKGYIMFDPLATDELGEPITVGRPFNQSSSTSIINGVKAQNIQASFEVLGTRKRGLATMVADGDGVQRLRLDVAGRSFEVSTNSVRASTRGGQPSASSQKGGRTSKVGKGEIIDAEIIDAEFKEKRK